MEAMISAGRFPTTRWRLREGNQDIEDLLVRELGISPIISRIIMSREICDPDVVRRYLSSSLQDLHNPFLMQDMKKVVDRLILAVYRNEKVVVYGDYDADGITSVVVLIHFLREIYPGATYHIP
ncbi:MAG: single-stranded-DNA-specific exonuclease RecJ, partial [Deltaproteobacteria bacterium]|nr:single-stranded-DNA-specific exonuclease RecJ [Deltaproteobacteria bacterium]